MAYNMAWHYIGWHDKMTWYDMIYDMTWHITWNDD